MFKSNFKVSRQLNHRFWNYKLFVFIEFYNVVFVSPVTIILTIQTFNLTFF